MSRAGWCVVLVGLAVVSLAGGLAVASAQPQPVCVVCGQSFHANVTGTDAMLQVQPNGDVHWRVENELAEPTASEWRTDHELADQRVEELLNVSRHPHDPTEPTVTVEGATVVVEFVDRDAARHRLGLLVVPYLHGEGVEMRYVINADTFVIEGPEGYTVANEPAGATVENGRAVWHGVAASSEPYRFGELGEAPEPDNTYVAFGAGPATGARGTVATATEPLDPVLYAGYFLGVVIVTGITFGLYTIEGTRLGRRRVAAGVAVVTFPYLYLVASTHPPQLGGLGGFVMSIARVVGTFMLGLVGGLLMFGWAAAADDRGPEMDG